VVDAVKLIPTASVPAVPSLPAYPAPDGSVPRLAKNASGGSYLVLNRQPYPVVLASIMKGSYWGSAEVKNRDWHLQQYDRAIAQGANTFRDEVMWQKMEPKDDIFNWVQLDDMIDSAKSKKPTSLL
jgi:hypothetical protein